MVSKEEFYSLIESRKSIRAFKSQPIERDKIERILSCAFHAPSGKNRQNWRFYVVQGQKRDEYLKYSQKSWIGIKDVLQQRLKPSLYDFTERFFYTLGNAPVLLFAYSYNSPDERHYTSIGSVYMAVENINLACLVEGLGSCTMGAPLEIEAEVSAFLGVDKLEEYQRGELELLCGMVIGYPDHNPPKAPRQTDGRVVWIS